MGIKNNLVSGVFAALAAVFTKVGFNFGEEGTINSLFLPQLRAQGFEQDQYLFALQYGLHVVFIALMLLSNGLMLRFYMRSMHENGAAKATVYNFAVNYLSSIAFGALFFDEKITQRLLVGVAFILSGTSLISTCKQEEPEESLQEKKQK